MKKVLLFVALFVSLQSFSQIQLPKGAKFYPFKKEYNGTSYGYSDAACSYFTVGRYSFRFDVNTNKLELFSSAERYFFYMKEFYDRCKNDEGFPHYTFMPLPNGLYAYYYADVYISHYECCIIIPKSLTDKKVVTLFITSSSPFSIYGKDLVWLLPSIQKARKKGLKDAPYTLTEKINSSKNKMKDYFVIQQ